MNENELRSELVRITKRLDALGMNHGSSGNPRDSAKGC